MIKSFISKPISSRYVVVPRININFGFIRFVPGIDTFQISIIPYCSPAQIISADNFKIKFAAYGITQFGSATSGVCQPNYIYYIIYGGPVGVPTSPTDGS